MIADRPVLAGESKQLPLQGGMSAGLSIITCPCIFGPRKYLLARQLREARRNGLLKKEQKFFWAMGGLRIVPVAPGVAVRDIVASIAGVTIFVLVLDGLLFRGHLTREYLDFYTSPLLPRVWVISAKAGIEEIKYRLVLMTGLALAYTTLRGKLDTPAAVGIIIAAKFANVGNLVLADPLYGTLR